MGCLCAFVCTCTLYLHELWVPAAGVRVLGKAMYSTEEPRLILIADKLPLTWCLVEKPILLLFFCFHFLFALFPALALAFGGRQVLLQLLPASPPSPLTLAATRWGARLMGPALHRAWSPSGRQNQREGTPLQHKVGRPVFKLRIRTSGGVSGHSLKATHQCHLELSTWCWHFAAVLGGIRALTGSLFQVEFSLLFAINEEDRKSAVRFRNNI